MNNVYTPKQRELLRIWQQGRLARINILEGSVRSGKTWITLVLWAFWVAQQPENDGYIMIAKTITSLERNSLALLEQLVGQKHFQYSTSAKKATLFGKKIYLEGVNDSRAEGKIRGMTLKGAYCDELTLFTEDFFSMLLTRLSVTGAKLFGTTNPDNPHHWLKADYIDRQDEIDLLDMKFLIDDNTKLDPDYVRQLKSENTGVFYDRFILGKWVAAEGAIYRLIADNSKRYMVDRKDVPPLFDICAGEDFGGNKSGHAIVCSGISSDNVLYFLKAKFHSAKGTTADDLVNWSISAFEDIYKDVGQYFGIYADSAEQVLINSIREKTRFSVYNALKRPIIDRIRALNILLATGRVKFVTGETEELIEALSSATWDDKKMDDTRLDNGSYNNDIIDAAEYSFEYNLNRLVT